jgi:prepilin-type N-terminal cleavage/methylation domain-containing protein
LKIKYSAKNSNGFTLIEVLVSITILAVISIYTATSIQQSIKSKKRYETEIDRRSQLRSALELITRDVNLAFNHRDIGAELYNLAWESRIKDAEEKERKGGGAGNPPGDPPDDPPVNPPPEKDPPAGGTLSQRLKQKYKKKEIRIFTHFLGSADKLDFTSRSYLRTMADAKSSDQIEVGYFLRDCKNRMNPKESSKCLVRRVSNLLDGKVDEGGAETVLLENVLQFVLRYTGEGYDDEWTDVWRTGDEASDARTKSNFPYAVEITLGIKEPEKPDSKGLSMTVVAQLRFPNNPNPAAANPTGQPAVPNNGAPQ